jgi:hypothetical protein
VVLAEPLRWLLEVVVGQRWPRAVEDDLQSAADIWRHLGGQIVEAQRAVEPAAGAVVASNTGPAVDAFAQFWERFSTQPVPRAVSVCAELELMLRQFADDVADVKAYILRQLEMLADEVKLRVSASGITVGVPNTAVKTAAATTRAAIGAALGELSARTAARTAARATATELLNDPTLATLRQLDDTRTLDLRQWAQPGTLATAESAPHGQPTEIGRTSLVHAPIQAVANPRADNSPSPLVETVSLLARESVLAGAGQPSGGPGHGGVPVAISTHPADQLNPRINMPSPQSQSLAMRSAADSPAPATSAPMVPTVAVTSVSVGRRSLISRAMAGED